MAKPNYSFEKRQRELAKKKKKEDKLREKADRKAGVGDGPPDDAAGPEDSQETAPATPADPAAPA